MVVMVDFMVLVVLTMEAAACMDHRIVDLGLPVALHSKLKKIRDKRFNLWKALSERSLPYVLTLSNVQSKLCCDVSIYVRSSLLLRRWSTRVYTAC